MGQKIPKAGALSFLWGVPASRGTLPGVVPCPPNLSSYNSGAGPLTAGDRVGGGSPGGNGCVTAERRGSGLGRSRSSDELDQGGLQGQKNKLGPEFSGAHTPGWDFVRLEWESSLRQEGGHGRRVGPGDAASRAGPAQSPASANQASGSTSAGMRGEGDMKWGSPEVLSGFQ